jgi:hypothetical protein
MSSVRSIAVAGRADGATTLPLGPLALDPARSRPAPARLGERRTARMVLMVGAVAVVGLPAAALAGALALMTLALAGPYLSLVVLSFAYALIVLIATAASG